MMALPIWFNEDELIVCERVGFFVLVASLFLENYNKSLLLILGLITLLVIYCLYLYNFVRDCWEIDCNKLEETREGVEKICLSSGNDHLQQRLREEQCKSKEIEAKFEVELLSEKEKIMKDLEKKFMDEFSRDTIEFMEQLRVYEEKIEVINEINKEKCATMEEEKRNIVRDLEREREKVLVLEERNCRLLKLGRLFLMSGNRGSMGEKVKLDFELEAKKWGASNLQWMCRKQDELEEQITRVSELEDKCMMLEEGKAILADELYKERLRVSELEEKFTRVGREKMSLGCELFAERLLNIPKLEEKCTRLEEEKASLDNELDEERIRVSELQEKCNRLEEDNCCLEYEVDEERLRCARLEEENRTLDYELEKEREMKRSCSNTSEQLLVVVEILKQKLDELVKKLDEKNMKLIGMSELKEKCKKLETEKKVWDAEKSKFLVLVDAQNSLVEEYKDRLNKDECLMKLFSVKTETVGPNEAAIMNNNKC